LTAVEDAAATIALLAAIDAGRSFVVCTRLRRAETAIASAILCDARRRIVGRAALLIGRALAAIDDAAATVTAAAASNAELLARRGRAAGADGRENALRERVRSAATKAGCALPAVLNDSATPVAGGTALDPLIGARLRYAAAAVTEAAAITAEADTSACQLGTAITVASAAPIGAGATLAATGDEQPQKDKEKSAEARPKLPLRHLPIRASRASARQDTRGHLMKFWNTSDHGRTASDPFVEMDCDTGGLMSSFGRLCFAGAVVAGATHVV
jgi:hypothetical protein